MMDGAVPLAIVESESPDHRLRYSGAQPPARRDRPASEGIWEDLH